MATSRASRKRVAELGRELGMCGKGCWRDRRMAGLERSRQRRAAAMELRSVSSMVRKIESRKREMESEREKGRGCRPLHSTRGRVGATCRAARTPEGHAALGLSPCRP
jgi:hypothetical protein